MPDSSKTTEQNNQAILEYEQKFSGNLFYSIWLYIGIIILAQGFYKVYAVINQSDSISSLGLFAIIVIIYWGLLLPGRMQYFYINKKGIIVKNHILWWQNEIITFEEIKHIVLLSTGRSSSNLVSMSFKNGRRSRDFGMAPLFALQWPAMASLLEENGVLVIDKTI